MYCNYYRLKNTVVQERLFYARKYSLLVKKGYPEFVSYSLKLSFEYISPS